MERGPGAERQSLQQASSVLQLHVQTQKTAGPQVSAPVFIRSIFFIKSVFSNVYSLVPACFNFMCAQQ